MRAARGLCRALLLAAIASSACSPSSSSSNPTTPSGAGVTDGDLATCVTMTNQFRATVGLGALTRSGVIETYAAAAVESDAASGMPHSYSISHNGGVTSGFWAENEALMFGLTSSGGTVAAVIRTALNLFWSEGPAGGHYQNIVGPYLQMGCGVFVDGPQVSVVQDFR